MERFMKTLQEIKGLISQVIRLVEADRRTEIQLNANGGNSILLICPPDQEKEYINLLLSMMDTKSYQHIDINNLLISYIKENRHALEESFDLLQSSLYQIFKSPDGETNNDFYNYLLAEIDNAFKKNKIPVLYNTGALYGTGIENIHLMEHKIVMNSNLPLIILYPATQKNDKLLFLDTRPGSRYRCMIIN